jgi:hypothetical protein
MFANVNLMLFKDRLHPVEREKYDGVLVNCSVA